MRPSRRQTPSPVKRWRGSRPSVTTLLIALSVGGFAAQWLFEKTLSEPGGRPLLFSWLALDSAGIFAGKDWKFFTFGLLHDSWWHLAADMLLLFFAGREVEPITGSRHFLGIFAAGNLAGGVAHAFAFPQTALVGLTAGVVAVIVAFTTMLPELEVNAVLFFLIPIRLRARYLAYALVGLAVTMWVAHAQLGKGVAMNFQALSPAALLAGSVAGWTYVRGLGFGNPLPWQRYYFRRRERRQRLARMNAQQFIRSEIDPILEKIANTGLASLSRAERKSLSLAREKMAQEEALKLR